MDQYLKERYHRKVIFAGLYVVQVNHSKDPLKGLYPHVHLIVLACANDKLLNKTFRIRPYLDVGRLRKLWSRAVAAKYGVSSKRPYNFHNQYGKISGIRHALSYAVRAPVHDLYKYVANGGQYCEDDVPLARRLLFGKRRKSKHVVWCGFLADGVKRRYLSKIDVKVLSLKEFQELNGRKKCLRCGSELYPVEGFDALLRFEDLPEGALIRSWSIYAGELVDVDVFS